MTRKKQILILFSFFCLNIYAQKWEWAFNGGGNYGYGITCDQVGNIYSLSSGNGPFGGSNLQGLATHMIAKQDPNQYIFWANALLNLEPAAIATDAQGNCYMTGRMVAGTQVSGILYGTNNSKTVTESGNGDAFLSKYSPSGDVEWAISWGNSSSEDYGTALQTDGTGNIYLTGHSRIWTGDDVSIVNAYLKKFDPTGNLIWTYETNWKGQVFPTDLSVDPAGVCYLTGNYSDTAYFSNILLPPHIMTAFVARFSSNGQVEWARKIGSNAIQTKAITLDPKKQVFISGAFTGPNTFDNFTLNTGGNFILKLDSTGSILCGNEAQNCQIADLVCDNNGNLYATGHYKESLKFTYSNPGAMVNTSRFGESFVVRLDENCMPLWLLSSSGSSPGASGAVAITAYQEGVVYTIGGFYNNCIFAPAQLSSPGTNPLDGSLNREIYIAKIKDETVITLLHKASLSIKLNVYPVPARSELHVGITSTVPQDVELTLTNVINQKILSRNFHACGNFNTILNVQNCPPGVYFVTILINGERQVKKVIIEN